MNEPTLKKRELITQFIEKGILITPEILTKINFIANFDLFYSNITKDINSGALVLNEQTLSNYIDDFQKKFEKKNLISTQDSGTVKVLFSYSLEPKKREMQHFVSYFRKRFDFLRGILENRKELASTVSINRLYTKQEKDVVSIIGIITEKQITKNNNVMLTLEDTTGKIKVLFTKNNPEKVEIAKDCVLDEVVGVCGALGNQVLFANEIIFPDVPVFKEMKKAPDTTYAVFIGDMHTGSKVFLKNEFQKFIDWISGNYGNESQREIASKVKYIFLVGDLIDGVGIYPNQEKDLEVFDVFEQYKILADYIKKIPNRIKIIICPGNHDAMRIAEPQPPLYKDFAKPFWELDNVIMVSNPSYINIHSSENFPGFDVLLYHGFSFPYYADNIKSIREKGGLDRTDLIMKFFLQRRHLAPTHTSTLYLPDEDKDNLVIEKVPDFFITGHVHKVSASNYRNVTMINCSCWLETTEYQEKLGIIPDPARVVVVDLHTRKLKILNFKDGD